MRAAQRAAAAARMQGPPAHSMRTAPASHIHTQLSQHRYYFYGQDAASGALILVEMVVATEARQASFTLKSEAPALVGPFLEVWSNLLAGFYR